MISSIVFSAVLAAGVAGFTYQVRRLRRGLALARPSGRHDRTSERWATMARVALGQGKMGPRPLAAAMHLIVYVGFVLINVEVLEILLDGVLGTHRLLRAPLGSFYDGLMNFFEVLGFLVIVACVVFLGRRLVAGPERLKHPDLAGWPQRDAVNILVIEIVLMSALLLMNAAEYQHQVASNEQLVTSSPWWISGLLLPLFRGWSTSALSAFATSMWWLHFVGILAFLNYLPRSKHFHIILAFPNVWYSKLAPRGQIPAMNSVTTEIKAMMDPSFVPDPNAVPPARFGAKDVHDLHFANLLNAYSCTECGRCTSECPANQTGKKLSPRRIMMATRDRVDEVLAGGESATQKTLLDDWISREELWACTTCNACVEACPVNIDPLDIILQMRQYLVMEESAAPSTVNVAMGNIENNAAPWAYPQADRGNWIQS
ncbi:MAG: 4Fe-4S dicluster domain-containing protein [Cryomorphaceae bacterium]|jgi:ferredoxin|nr:4Fe-4S dicluster domain-containing protein [Cryomorphaceae bacterium]